MKAKSDINNKLKLIAQKFDIENDLIHFLFLIGIQESGYGFKQFSKAEKTDLIELGAATVLSAYGYYTQVETESDIPYYVINPDKELPETYQKERLLKAGIIDYFSKKTKYDAN